MVHSLNTVRALLEAQNFDGARRLVNEFLEETPDDIRCWILRIKIELEAKDYKEALRISRQNLQQHPENVDLRELEFEALADLRRKREARKNFDKFKSDFPDYHDRIQNMQLCLDALQGKAQKVYQHMESLGVGEDDPDEKLDIGIFCYKACDYFRAQQYMMDAFPFYSDNLELNKALAQNSLILGKLATARVHARIALRLSPGDRHMRTLIAISYIYYLPQFYLLNKFLMLFNLASSYLGLLLAFAIAYFTLFIEYDTRQFLNRTINIVLNLEIFGNGYLIFGVLLAQFLVHCPHYFKFIYERKKEVKLKRF